MTESSPLLDIEDSLEKSGLDLEKHSDLTKRLDSLPFSKWHIYLILALGLNFFIQEQLGYSMAMKSRCFPSHPLSFKLYSRPQKAQLDSWPHFIWLDAL